MEIFTSPAKWYKKQGYSYYLQYLRFPNECNEYLVKQSQEYFKTKQLMINVYQLDQQYKPNSRLSLVRRNQKIHSISEKNYQKLKKISTTLNRIPFDSTIIVFILFLLKLFSCLENADFLFNVIWYHYFQEIEDIQLCRSDNNYRESKQCKYQFLNIEDQSSQQCGSIQFMKFYQHNVFSYSLWVYSMFMMVVNLMIILRLIPNYYIQFRYMNIYRRVRLYSQSGQTWLEKEIESDMYFIDQNPIQVLKTCIGTNIVRITFFDSLFFITYFMQEMIVQWFDIQLIESFLTIRAIVLSQNTDPSIVFQLKWLNFGQVFLFSSSFLCRKILFCFVIYSFNSIYGLFFRFYDKHFIRISQNRIFRWTLYGAGIEFKYDKNKKLYVLEKMDFFDYMNAFLHNMDTNLFLLCKNELKYQLNKRSIKFQIRANYRTVFLLLIRKIPLMILNIGIIYQIQQTKYCSSRQEQFVFNIGVQLYLIFSSTISLLQIIVYGLMKGDFAVFQINDSFKFYLDMNHDIDKNRLMIQQQNYMQDYFEQEMYSKFKSDELTIGYYVRKLMSQSNLISSREVVYKEQQTGQQRLKINFYPAMAITLIKFLKKNTNYETVWFGDQVEFKRPIKEWLKVFRKTQKMKVRKVEVKDYYETCNIKGPRLKRLIYKTGLNRIQLIIVKKMLGNQLGYRYEKLLFERKEC